MPMTTPAEVSEAFLAAFNSGDIEAILSYYGPDGVFVTEQGQALKGPDEIRPMLEDFMAMKPNLQSDNSKLISAGDLAVNVMKWTLTGTGPDGAAVSMQGSGFDVMRRQPDGSWNVVVDNPWGAAILD